MRLASKCSISEAFTYHSASFTILLLYLGVTMSKLEYKDIEKIAHLARLHPMADADKQCHDFNNLLGLFESICEVDTDGIDPLAHPLDDVSQPLRDDTVSEIDQSTLFQTLAPSTEAGLYLVPAAIADKDSNK